MSITRWLAIAAALFTPAAFAAQDLSPSADPTDAHAEAAPFSYESAFASYRGTQEPDEMPDKAWRAANDEMGRLGGHAGHVKNSPDSAPAATTTRPGAVSNAAPAHPKAMSVDHGGHGMHH